MPLYSYAERFSHASTQLLKYSHRLSFKKISISILLCFVTTTIPNACLSKGLKTPFKSQNSSSLKRNRGGNEKSQIKKKIISSYESDVDLKIISFSLLNNQDNIQTERLASILTGQFNGNNLIPSNGDQTEVNHSFQEEESTIDMSEVTNTTPDSSIPLLLSGTVNQTRSNASIKISSRNEAFTEIDQDFTEKTFASSFSKMSGTYHGF